jgi:hypothetical protein
MRECLDHLVETPKRREIGFRGRGGGWLVVHATALTVPTIGVSRQNDVEIPSGT